MSKKRQRDPATIDTQLVEIYDDLANESEDIRLKAAHSLLSKVSPEDTPTKERLLEILTRLIRGLCSPRKAARLGFSVALTEFLVQTQGKPEKDLPAQLDVQEVIEILKKQTVAGGNVSGNVLLPFPNASVANGTLQRNSRTTTWDVSSARKQSSSLEYPSIPVSALTHGHKSWI